jgi:ornithine carbamoyltransferase
METSNMSDIVQRYNASTVLVCVNKTAASITKSSQIATDAAQSAVDNSNGGYNASVMMPALARELGKHYQRARRLLAAKGHKFMNYHCVPITRYAELRTAFAEVSDDYAKCVRYWTGSDAMYDKYVAECQELHKGLWCESLLPVQ